MHGHQCAVVMRSNISSHAGPCRYVGPIGPVLGYVLELLSKQDGNGSAQQRHPR